jgi:putative transposase
MATKQRHTAAQIATKLAMADQMATQGRLHGDIAKSLEISLMTYHRWRKARGAMAQPHPIITELPTPPDDGEQASQIRELQSENSRLRRLVADLLLEKVKLEENLHENMFDRRTAKRN